MMHNQIYKVLVPAKRKHEYEMEELKNQINRASSIDGLPSSCADLWTLGHSRSGIYLVKTEASIDAVYCDMTKNPTSSSGQLNNHLLDLGHIQYIFQIRISI